MINAIAEAHGLYSGGHGGSQNETSVGTTDVAMSVQDMQTLHWAFVSKKGKPRVAVVVGGAVGPVDETDAWVKYCQQMAMRGVAAWNLR